MSALCPGRRTKSPSCPIFAQRLRPGRGSAWWRADRLAGSVLRVFENAELLDPEREAPERASLVVRDGRIVECLGADTPSPGDAQRIDLKGLSLAPGFIDLHFHGELVFARGDRFSELLARAGRARLAEGTTAFLATTVAWPGEKLAHFVSRLAREIAEPRGEGALPIGIHLEGPWINPAAAGAQPSEAIRECRRDEVLDVLARGEGNIRLVTLAPEVAGSRVLLESLARAGVVAALGHSLAQREEIDVAVGEGLRHVTHLFNAMGGVHQREPGVAGHALADDRLSCDLICDGVHVHPDLVVTASRAKGNQLALITDRVELPSEEAGGFGSGSLRDDGVAIRLPDGRLAGSALSLDRALRNAIRFGAMTRLEAVKACTLRPARVLGMEAERGTLRPGARADFAVLDPDGQVVQTWVDGRCVYGAAERSSAIA